MTDVRVLKTALGRYAGTARLLDGEIPSSRLRLDVEKVAPISKAFAPMVRSGKFEVSEMAIATFLMARAYDKPLVLLPVVLVERAQEAAMLCRRDGPIQGPADLAGAHIAVRAYSQTTGMWLRGSLAESFGVKADQQRWTTFEGAHVAEFSDPPFVTRAPADGPDLLAMLRSGAADAAIFGNDMPDAPDLRPVFADAQAAGAAFKAKHGFLPLNHLVVMRRDVVEGDPSLVPELLRMLKESGAAVRSRAELRPALALAIDYCFEQGLLPHRFTPEEAWAGLPAEVA
ncbi:MULTISPECIES: type 2 periplasmic-binding domain-containing protein [Roseomonadaceae]|uniref:ABC transporter substrate-binding protein n=1 Tax=Falsiroseomonas oleicola TaxID=2801474 RepID=A0ABS6HEX1_9PROT|nr:ABC transporter substrate-binding protein [Roseomonas oleicola]MBU8547297.1 ABC transporter substrate-binding protein [Roseomonas oleicola]